MPAKKTQHADPWLFSKKTPFMQRIADRVRGGSTNYILGSCKLEKVPNLVQKFADRYPINAPKITQARRRAAGLGAYSWIGYLEAESGLVHWILLLDQGKEPDTTDKWLNALSDKIELTGYELVRLTREGASKPAWTWRYTRQRHDDIRNALVSVIRGRRDHELEQLIHSAWRSPGFSGVREQVKKFRQLIVSEWRRSRSSLEKMPEIPKGIGFVRRIPDVGDVWSKLITKKE